MNDMRTVIEELIPTPSCYWRIPYQMYSTVSTFKMLMNRQRNQWKMTMVISTSISSKCSTSSAFFLFNNATNTCSSTRTPIYTSLLLTSTYEILDPVVGEESGIDANQCVKSLFLGHITEQEGSQKVHGLAVADVYGHWEEQKGAYPCTHRL